MELKTMSSNQTEKLHAVNKIEILLGKYEEVAGYPGYYWAILPKDDDTRKPPPVKNIGSVEFKGEVDAQTCVVGQPKYRDQKLNYLFGEQYHVLDSLPETIRVSGDDPRPISKGMYQYLVWTGPRDGNPPPDDYSGLKLIWDTQYKFTGTLEEGDPPTVEVEDPDDPVEFHITLPVEGQQYSPYEGAIDLNLDGVILVNGKQAPDDDHRWYIDGNLVFTGPKTTKPISLKLAAGPHEVKLQYDDTIHHETVTIQVA